MPMRLSSSMMPVITVLALAVGVSCATRLAPAAPMVTSGGVRFVFERAGAKSVAVAGTFNEWSTRLHPLARAGPRGLWTAVVTLPPGEHLFMYVVDGNEWVSPPHAEDHVDDGFGAKNGVVIVRPTDR